MDELFKRLEKQIKTLIDQHDLLKQSNQQMHQGRFSLLRDKELLLAKQRKAVAQIQQLVSRLKTIEKENHDG